MVNVLRRLRLAGGLVVCLTGCQPAVPPVNVHQAMTTVVNPQATTLWDIGNRAMDDAGNPDASKLSDADWEDLTQAAEAVAAVAKTMATAQSFVAAAKAAKLQDEGVNGGVGAAAVQGYIDADRSGFNEKARSLAAIADKLHVAAMERDAAALAIHAGELDQVCEACHKRYWYPEPR